MNYLISGASGLVGKVLVEKLRAEGHLVKTLVRRNSGSESELSWYPEKAELDANHFKDIDVVIHLGGENIAAGRWTESLKKRIRDSRVVSTSLISETINKLERKPKLFICASAIGIYGDRGEEELSEESSPGVGFLVDVGKEWETAANKAQTRVINARIGVVISKEGGALKKMLIPFLLGLGGRLGSGRQFMSWVDIDDLVDALVFLSKGELSGPVNLVSPNPVTNSEITKTLGRVLSRPTIFPVPAFVLKLLVGEMAEALLLSSTKVLPKKLQASGFLFKAPELEICLRKVLKR